MKQRRSPFENQINFEFRIHANSETDLEIRRIDGKEEKTLQEAIHEFLDQNPGVTSQQVADGIKKRKSDVVKMLQSMEDEFQINVMSGQRGAKFYSPRSMF